MGSSASLPESGVYPSLDLTTAEPAESLNPSSFNPTAHISRNVRHSSPLDNIPFAFQMPGSNGSGMTNGNSVDDYKEITDRLRRVEQFVQSSAFAYNFQLESSIIRQTV